MSVLQMQRISICALKKDRKPILKKIQSMGVVEMDLLSEEESGLKTMDTQNARQSFEKTANIAEQAYQVVESYIQEKKSMFSSLEGKKLLKHNEFDDLIKYKEKIMDEAREVLSHQKTISECKAGIVKNNTFMEGLKPWSDLEVPMNYSGTKSTAFIIGTMPVGFSLEAANETLFKELQVEAYNIEILNSDRDAVYLAVVCMREDAVQVEEVLRKRGFAKPTQLIDKTPAEFIEKLKRENEGLESKIVEVENKIKEYSGKRESLKYISDYYRMRADRYELLGNIPQSESTFVLRGYMPKKAAPAILKGIGEKYDCVVEIEDLQDDEEAPVILNNNSFAEAMEGITCAYGLPGKKEIDPTMIMSMFYIFFFGLMLSDAAYGAIITTVCFVLLKKFPRMEKSMFTSIKMFMFCGISTFLWGVLFGGYFGDAITVIAEKFFNAQVTIPAVWFVPIDEPMKMLLYSLLFGMIHLFVGLGIKGYLYLKQGDIKSFLGEVVGWFMLLAGLIMMLIPTDIFESLSGTKIVFPDTANTAIKWLAIIGALLILIMKGHESKNWGVRIAVGAYGLYDITGWLSDVLSYSRLLALGLATGVIAQVMNQMAGMLGDGILGALAFIVIFVIGHTFNMAINILGAYVHTNRLQFVEFFGKFYEGVGREFKPFYANTKYVDIKEEF
ncbi:MAG: V-type ATP synthase subunit I [Aminipila sp.]